MDKLSLIYAVFVIFLPLTAIFSFTPYICKKGTSFGVMLPDEAKKNPQLKIMCRHYSAICAAAGICLGLIGLMSRQMNTVMLCALLYIIICGVYFALCGRLVKNIVMHNDYENLQKPVYIKLMPHEIKEKNPSLFLTLILLAPMAATCYIWYSYPADGGYYIPLLQAVLFCAVLAGFIMLRRFGHYVNKNNAMDDMRKNSAVRRRLSFLILWIAFGLECFLLVMQLCLAEIIKSTPVVNAAPAVVCIAVTGCLIAFCYIINR